MRVARVLLWKEFRQNGGFLIAAAVFLSVPYIIAAGAWTLVAATQNHSSSMRFQDFMIGALGFDLFILMLLCACIAANAVAGERVDRSAEFFGSMPVSRWLAAVCKIALGFTVCLAVLLSNLAIAWLCGYWGPNFPETAPEDGAWWLLATLIFLFGVSWMFSTAVRNPTHAAAASFGSLGLISMTLGWFDLLTPRNLGAGCLVCGVFCIFAGTAYYVQRAEP